MEARIAVAALLLAGWAAGCAGPLRRRPPAVPARHEPARQQEHVRQIDPHDVWNSAQRGQNSPQPPAFPAPTVAPAAALAAAPKAEAPPPAGSAARPLPALPPLRGN